MTFALIIKLVLTSCFAYLTLNSFFRFQYSTDRFVTIYSILIMILMFIFKDNNDYTTFLIIVSIITVILGSIALFFISRKEYGIFLITAKESEYDIIKEELTNCLEIKAENFEYNRKTYYYLKLKNINFKTVNIITSKLDKFILSKKKKLNMSSYWYFISLLILVAAIWRF